MKDETLDRNVLEHQLWKRVWTCRKAYYVLNNTIFLLSPNPLTTGAVNIIEGHGAKWVKINETIIYTDYPEPDNFCFCANSIFPRIYGSIVENNESQIFLSKTFRYSTTLFTLRVETDGVSFYCDIKLENFVRPSWQKSKKGCSRVTGRTELKYEREKEREAVHLTKPSVQKIT